MHSVRRIAECLGLEGSFRVVNDFFGYVTGSPWQVSLSRQLRLMKTLHVDLNLIRVGVELFTPADEKEIDRAVAFMRDTYAHVDFGVGRVRRYGISLADADGHEHIADDKEAEELTHAWSVHNDVEELQSTGLILVRTSLDVFFVRTFAGSALGSAPRDGPYDNDADGAMTGVVIAMEGTPADTGFVLAKYVARYLGLKPSDRANNLMYDWVPNGGHLTRDQYEEMTKSGFANAGCGWTVMVSW